LIYTQSTKGHSLEEDLHPSMPFPIKGQEEQTPMHLAALGALKVILILFLDHGGNPNIANGREETSFHCVCQRPDSPEKRAELLSVMLNWKGPEIDGEVEEILVNHVDSDGYSLEIFENVYFLV